MKSQVWLAVSAAITIVGLGFVPAYAQQPQPFGQAPASAPKSPAKAAKPAAPVAPNAEQPAGSVKAASDNPLRSRVEQLEEQLVDLQVTIGTLESLARTAGTSSSSAAFRGPPAASSGSGDGSVVARVDGLEIQIRALVAQVEQLNDQVRALGSRRGAGPDSSETTRVAGPQPAAGRPASSGFGSTTVTPGGGAPAGGDQIGKLLTEDALPVTPAAVPGGDGGNPKQLYETAYGYLLQQNYGAAETAFDDFLARHPNDALAGNAQYWLGESHFVRGQYKQAAGAFLKGYQAYGRSAKAPDSLLKLAMSLDRLGQKDAACTSYGELNTRFPTAPQNVKARADSERRRIGC